MGEENPQPHPLPCELGVLNPLEDRDSWRERRRRKLTLSIHLTLRQAASHTLSCQTVTASLRNKFYDSHVGLNCGPTEDMPWSPERYVIVMLFGKGVFAGVSKLRIWR